MAADMSLSIYIKLSSTLPERHEARALITELPVVVTLGASIGILSGVVLFPEKA